MKELSIEEKAQRYDEALKVLHKYDGAHIMFTQDLKEEMFPELKDESIKKALIHLVRVKGEEFGFIDANTSVKDAISWLEAQGSQDNAEDVDILHRFSFYSYKDEPNVLYLSGLYVNEEYRNKGIGTKILEVADEVVKILNCRTIRLKTKKDSDAERLYRTHGYNSLALAIEDKDEIWLEKQGEQKLVDDADDEAEKEKNDYVSGQFLYCKGSFNEFKEGESYWIEYIGNDTYIGRSDNILNQKFHITPRQLYTWLDPRHPEKQDEQKPIKEHDICNTCEEKASCIIPCPMKLVELEHADKIEPKFKAGDKVLADGKVYTIKLVNEDNYIVDENGRDVQEHFSYTKDWKLYEQNPIDKVEPKFKIGQTIVYKGTEIITPTKMTISDIVKGQYWDDNCCIVPISDQDNWELVEQKSNNKVEPKFHEGDWVVYNNDICQIVKREEGCNKLVTIFGIEKELVNERNLSTARLWTIQDAKDGDVLVYKDEIFIAKNSSNLNIVYYCCYDNYHFITESIYSLTVDDLIDIKPATKEQRDTLFAKIKEAGYEWDAEKKELKKIEQKPADIPEDFERLVEHLLSLSDGEGHGSPAKVKEVSSELLRLANQRNSVWSVEDDIMKHHCHQMLALLRPNSSELIKDIIDNCHHWLKSIKSKVQPKIEWSERDELMLEASIGFIKSSPYPYSGDTFRGEISKIDAENWLETLKYRVQPQPKEEWTEEDENRFKNLIELVKQSNEGIGTKVGFVKFINRLKSLKPQPKQERCKEDNTN